jgi:tetratricopeptide (TPR) repeat protein
MTTRFRAVSAASVALVVAVSLSTAGCGKYSYNNLKAMKAFKEGNDRYRQQEWKRAAEKYEAAIAANPDLVAGGVTPYFFLGNSYDNLFKSAKVGEPENDAYMQKAIENYKKSAERDTDTTMRKRAMEYLVAAFGPDKLNDPSQAEPIVQQMIQIDPSEPANYFALSGIYEGAGRYEEAEQALFRARDARPNDPLVYTTMSGFYNRQGDFAKTIEGLQKAAELEPTNPQGFHLIATYYEEKARKDFRITTAQKKEYAIKGIEAEDKALSLNPSYVDAMVYKNILLRQQANAEPDRAKQAELIRQADELRSKAITLQKGAKATGAR